MFYGYNTLSYMFAAGWKRVRESSLEQ